jgi:D-serine deaminase-like pyridoxal phosphate-dependent protein
MSFPEPQVKELLLSHFKGKQWNELPTPSFVVSESVVNANTANMLKRVEKMGTRFRGHVKTHKTIEVTKKQLGYDLPDYDGSKHDSIVASTLKEIWSIIKYQKETGDIFVKDAIFGLPAITDYTLNQAIEIGENLEKFTLMIDSLEHLDIIQSFNQKKGINKKWSVIIKLDIGTHRAGILNTDYLVSAIHKVLDNQNVELYGFYVHSGHSYASHTIEDAEDSLLEELETVKKGLDELYKIVPQFDQAKLVVSVGATPTLHSLEHHLFAKTNQRISDISREIKATLELHAGNYPFCDLQQASTGCIDESNIAVAVTATVISQYPKRKHPVGELLINAGVIALSKEVATAYPGYGLIKTASHYGSWGVNRLSQEHGILQPNSDDSKLIPIGTTVKVLPNHSCITANSFNAFYVLNDDGVVVDVWIPWRGW